MTMQLRVEPASAEHEEELLQFLTSIEGADRTFLGAQATEPATIGRMVRQEGGRHYVALAAPDDGASSRIIGFSGVTLGSGWSSHVGQLRVVVAPGQRGRGLGGQLALAALAGALACGLEKVVVEVRSDQVPVQNLFAQLGFRPEALLTDHLKGPDGTTHDLLTLAHRVEEVSGLLIATGLGQAQA